MFPDVCLRKLNVSSCVLEKIECFQMCSCVSWMFPLNLCMLRKVTNYSAIAERVNVFWFVCWISVLWFVFWCDYNNGQVAMLRFIYATLLWFKYIYIEVRYKLFWKQSIWVATHLYLHNGIFNYFLILIHHCYLWYYNLISDENNGI